jgi:signal transduction histidine kinase/CheY-like chemotaxis protein
MRNTALLTDKKGQFFAVLISSILRKAFNINRLHSTNSLALYLLFNLKKSSESNITGWAIGGRVSRHPGYDAGTHIDRISFCGLFNGEKKMDIEATGIGMGEDKLKAKHNRELYTDNEKIYNQEELVTHFVHDLNNLLSSILGYAQLLAPKAVDQESKEDIEKIISETDRASHMVKNLAAFSNKRSPKKEVVELRELIEATLDQKAYELNLRNIQVSKEFAVALPPISIDPRQIQQVLVNLINNAEEAISEYHGFGEIKVSVQAAEAAVRIIISDDGPGIPEETKSKMFDPFFVAKGKGPGLGMSTAYRIVAAHGGKIEVESQWGSGTTFTITLPMPEMKKEEEREKKMQPRKELQGRNGLVIDDEWAVRALVSKFLGNEGCRIESAQDVKTALNLIEEIEFDFIICDMKMPELGGEEFYKMIQDKKPLLKDKIIFFTGDILGHETKTFIDSTKNPYLEKPFVLKDLKKAVLNIINK